MDQFSFLGNSEIDSVEELYLKYKDAPDSVEESWRQFFKGFEFAQATYNGEETSGKLSTKDNEVFEKEFKVINLIKNYRQRGHLFTKTNPVRTRRKYFPTLDIENFGLSTKDLETVFQAGNEIGIGAAKLKDIVAHMEQTYCRSIGVEYVFVRKPEMVEWLQTRMEGKRNTPTFSKEQKKNIYFHLRQAVGFEKFIHKKFVGQKRFSLEGAESLIPALQFVMEKGAGLGLEEFIIGMPHRGRLNVLANILRKPYENIFQEFVGQAYNGAISLGDVKYHLGYCNEITTATGKKVTVNLVPNPSHLETVGPVTEGIARAKIENKYGGDFSKLAPIVIHGDAAIAAQGVVYETIQMAQLEGYKTGGTIHLVINNQVGFTTNYLDARSSTYCTDVAKVTRSPVFHVNGDDPEALSYTIKTAMEYRQQFHTDVFIDLLCYRKYGHNEGDEPRFTQPVLYDIIAKHPNPRDIYGDKLIAQGIFTKDDLIAAEQDFEEILDEKLLKSKSLTHVHIDQFLEKDWDGYKYSVDEDFEESPYTGIEQEQFDAIVKAVTTLPDDQVFFNKLVKLVKDRRTMAEEDRLDWAMGEHLAYGSLLKEGFSVRISGQDVERGTFSHRHASLLIKDTEDKYFPLKHVGEKQGKFRIYNSLLSEYAVMGFEYGYALSSPKSLTIWEAQFGDFSNVAQPIIDQYFTSAEEKWGLMNGLVLLLPHGYEGQGPEHSSARIERFLGLAANNNIQVLNCTTPASLFHALRRQMHRDFRVPMVIFTPKSLLRHPMCVSKVSDFTSGRFKELIDDTDVDVADVKRVVFCTGKIYYDLLAKKEEYQAKDVALVRMEQLHPFPTAKFEEVVQKYSNAKLFLWVQEEPENMGAWWYIQNNTKGVHLEPVARPQSASPAVGLNKLHVKSQEYIIDKVFRKCDCDLGLKYCGLQCQEGSSHDEVVKFHRLK